MKPEADHQLKHRNFLCNVASLNKYAPAHVVKHMQESPDAPIALVVDDNLLILMDACDILTEAGFRTREAHDVEEAIRELEKLTGDVTLLFTDVQMPGGRNGFDLARETAERWPEVKILVASGAIEPKMGDMPEGAIFVGKPFSAHVVHDRLNELLPDGAKPEPLKRGAV